MTINDVLLTKIKGTWGTDFSDSENGVAVIKTNNLSYEGEIDFTDICYRNIDKEKAKKLYLQNGDLLVEKSGGTRTHTVGYVNYFDNKNDYFVCNNFILALRPDSEKVFPKYLFWQMRCMYETGRFSDCYNKTTGIQNLKDEFYLSKEIIVPPKNQQQKIATHLDKITQGINNKKKQLALFDELVKSKFAEMFGDPVTNEMGWEKFQLKSLYKVSSSKRIYQNEQTESGIPFLRISDLVQLIDENKFVPQLFISEEKFSEFKHKNLVPKAEDILITSRGTLGRCYIINEKDEFYFQDGMITWLSEKKDTVNNIYIVKLFEMPAFKKFIENSTGGATVSYLSITQISNLQIPLPPFPLQNQFATFVQKCGRAKSAVKQEIACLQELLDSKMQEYFS